MCAIVVLIWRPFCCQSYQNYQQAELSLKKAIELEPGYHDAVEELRKVTDYLYPVEVRRILWVMVSQWLLVVSLYCKHCFCTEENIQEFIDNSVSMASCSRN